MPFDMDKLNEGEWFRYFDSSINENGDVVYLDPDPEAERVCLRSMDSDTLEDIYSKTRKKYHENVLNPKTRTMERMTYFDQTPEQAKTENALMWDYAITDWELRATNGDPIPCTKENKIKLMKHPPFTRFVIRCLQISRSSKIEQEEQAEKNS